MRTPATRDNVLSGPASMGSPGLVTQAARLSKNGIAIPILFSMPALACRPGATAKPLLDAPSDTPTVVQYAAAQGPAASHHAPCPAKCLRHAAERWTRTRSTRDCANALPAPPLTSADCPQRA